MDSNRNEFTNTTKDLLAKRAGQHCSNPYCKQVTSGPHTEDSKAVNVGQAAHIKGANPGSARYNPEMTPTERSEVTNGIWLCSKCATLIDRDEKRFTVDLLYSWKRNHEKEISLQLEGHGLERGLLEFNLKSFEIESPAARQIALDKPKYWEYLLTVELLRTKMEEIKRDYKDLRRGLIYRPSKILTSTDFITWIQQKLADLQAIMPLISTTVNEDLMAAFGKPGEPGDPLEIKRSVDKIIYGCKSFFEWEVELYFVKFPEKLEHVKERMKGWTNDFVEESDRIHKELSKIFELPNPSGRYEIQLTFKAPEGTDEIVEEVRLALLG
jgi:hypothetical protein